MSRHLASAFVASFWLGTSDKPLFAFPIALASSSSVPLLSELVINKTQDTISLANGVDLEIKTASAAGIRGISACAIIADEAAFWTTDTASANADSEILTAARPALATTGGVLAIISSPYARRGEVWDLFDRHFGSKGDPAVLVVHGESRAFNSSLPKAVVDRALARNPIAARAEYLAEFRSTLEGFVSLSHREHRRKNQIGGQWPRPWIPRARRIEKRRDQEGGPKG